MSNAIGIVRFSTSERKSMCTGFLVAASWAVTAGHCRPGSGEPMGEWLAGPSEALAHTSVEIRRWVVHPQIDVALVELSRNVGEFLPVGLHRQDPTIMIGSRAEIAGFGASEDSQGERRFAVVKVADVTETYVLTAGSKAKGRYRAASSFPRTPDGGRRMHRVPGGASLIEAA